MQQYCKTLRTGNNFAEIQDILRGNEAHLSIHIASSHIKASMCGIGPWQTEMNGLKATHLLDLFLFSFISIISIFYNQTLDVGMRLDAVIQKSTQQLQLVCQKYTLYFIGYKALEKKTL